jgi:gamma-glutamylcysteine synthetase
MNTIQNLTHSILRRFALAVCAVGVLSSAMAAPLAAAESTAAVATGKTSEARRMSARKSTYPFRGEVAAVEGKSIVLAKKSGAAVRLEDVKPGDYLRGMLQKTDAGGEVLVRASAGGKYDKPLAKSGKSAAKTDKAER